MHMRHCCTLFTPVLMLQHLLPNTNEEIESEILSMKNKTCELDTIPTNLLKDILLTVLETYILLTCHLQLVPFH